MRRIPTDLGRLLGTIDPFPVLSRVHALILAPPAIRADSNRLLSRHTLRTVLARAIAHFFEQQAGFAHAVPSGLSVPLSRPVRGKWVRARYIGERQVIEQQYAEWEITGPPRFATSIPARLFQLVPGEAHATRLRYQCSRLAKASAGRIEAGATQRGRSAALARGSSAVRTWHTLQKTLLPWTPVRPKVVTHVLGTGPSPMCPVRIH